MRLLIWCSTLSYGGGERLLSDWLRPSYSDASIKKLGLAMPERARQSFAEQATNISTFICSTLPSSNYRQWTTFALRAADFVTRYIIVRAFADAEQLQRTLDKWLIDFDVLYCFWAQSEPFVKSALPVVITIQDLTALEFPEISWRRTNRRNSSMTLPIGYVTPRA